MFRKCVGHWSGSRPSRDKINIKNQFMIQSYINNLGIIPNIQCEAVTVTSVQRVTCAKGSFKQLGGRWNAKDTFLPHNILVLNWYHSCMFSPDCQSHFLLSDTHTESKVLCRSLKRWSILSKRFSGLLHVPYPREIKPTLFCNNFMEKSTDSWDVNFYQQCTC